MFSSKKDILKQNFHLTLTFVDTISNQKCIGTNSWTLIILFSLRVSFGFGNCDAKKKVSCPNKMKMKKMHPPKKTDVTGMTLARAVSR